MKLIVNKTLSPKSIHGGGVGNYYRVLRKHSNEFTFLDGTYSLGKNRKWKFIKDFFKAYYSFLRKSKKSNVIVFNTSLGGYSVFRDILFIGVANLFKKKYIIFFRGWNDAYAEKISNKYFYYLLFKIVYKKRANAYIVLSKSFKKKLIEWGINKPIHLETTIVDDEMLSSYDNYNKEFDKVNILFLSRIEKVKGIFEALEAVNILLEKERDLQFTIAGNGSAFEELKTNVTTLDTNRITLKGYVKGDEKTACFSSASMFLFPSVHGEGMPNSILEAMAFGLPVLTTRVGGIPDFFEEGKMGLFLDSREPEHIAEKIEYLLDRPELMKEMGEYNYNYAKEHFYANKVAARLEKIIDDVVEGRV